MLVKVLFYSILLFYSRYILFTVVAVSASVLFLAAISGERFFAIVYPLKRKFSKITVHLVVIILIWTVAVIMALPNVLVRNLQVGNRDCTISNSSSSRELGHKLIIASHWAFACIQYIIFLNLNPLKSPACHL